VSGPDDGWEEFRRAWATPGVRSAGPRATITRAGVLRLGRDALELLGRPAVVALSYHREARLIGVRCATADEPDGYRISPDTGADLMHRVFAAGFLRHYGIGGGRALWARPALHGDRLVFPLDESAPLASGRHAPDARGRRNRPWSVAEDARLIAGLARTPPETARDFASALDRSIKGVQARIDQLRGNGTLPPSTHHRAGKRVG